VATSETDRFAAFFGMLGHRLEHFQRQIVEEIFSPRRETLVLIPRGCGKSTLLAAVALWSLLRGRGQQIVVGAASREQASVLFDIARQMAQHAEIAPRVEVTRREIRTTDGWLKVIAADGPRQHGLIVDLAIVDELHAHRTDELYLALRTSMLKRPGARMVTISTAGARVETPLGALRQRSLKLPHVTREGALTRAVGDNMAMLAWELPEGATTDELEAVKAANPASWVTVEGLAEQREAVHELGFARYHANVWTGGEGPLDPGRHVGCLRRRAGDRGRPQRGRRRGRLDPPRHHRGGGGTPRRAGAVSCALAGLGTLTRPGGAARRG
jgi:phage terminase large subunit-like protein